MSKDEAYMLPRDSSETRRLEVQHQFLLALSNGHLIHPSIPQKTVRTVADVGTGTGIWLREFAEGFDGKPNPEFVGFDISPQQFPENKPLNQDFIVHDMTKPFPKKYLEYFDVVNVRLLSYALKAQDLQQAVQNVVQIISPGGYLQWQEADFTDAWATPETEAARSVVSYVTAERVARGLEPCIVTPLVKQIQLLSTPIKSHQKNSIVWTNDLVRIIHLETLSTENSPSRFIQAEKSNHTLTAAVVLLRAGAARRKRLAADSSVSSEEGEQLMRDADAMVSLVEAIEKGEDPAKSRWDGLLTWIVGRKAIVTEETKP